MTKITGTLHEDQYTFVTLCSCILRKIKDILDRFVEKIKTNFFFIFFTPKIVPFVR